MLHVKHKKRDDLNTVIWVLLGIVLVFMISMLIYATYLYNKDYDDGEMPLEIKYGNRYAGVTAAIQPRVTCAYVDDRLEYEPIVSESQSEELPEWFDYLCQCVEAEAGDQDYLGKCYVVDVILNRVDSKYFPDNVVDVINEPRQFEVVLNGRINKVEVTESTRQAVMEELTGERKNYEILFFCMWKFDWCEFLFQHGDHYFHK